MYRSWEISDLKQERGKGVRKSERKRDGKVRFGPNLKWAEIISYLEREKERMILFRLA
jgi:hypothetical protein